MPTYEPVGIDEDSKFPPRVEARLAAEFGEASYTKVESDARYEPLDSAYTKVEADARYEPLDSAYTKAEADARYEPLDSAYTKAEANALLAAKADDSDLVGLITATAAQAQADARILTGAFLSRPVASTVRPGTIFAPNDVPELFVSTGATWLVYGGAGQELGYAEAYALASVAGSGYVDVAGLTVTFIAPSRPITINVHARMANTQLGEISRASIRLDGVEVQRIESEAAYASVWRTSYGSVRIAGLTPGTSHTAKVMLSSNGTGPALMGGDPTLPNNIQVVTV